MNVDQVKRATGRTTRMLKDAIEHHKQGYQMVVLAHSQTYARDLMFKMYKMSGEQVPVDSYHSYLVNPKVREIYRDHKLFIDHYAIEREFPDVIGNWIKYDEPTPQPNWVVDGSCPKEAGLYLVSLRKSGRDTVHATHWHNEGGWLPIPGLEDFFTIAWAPMPKPFGYTGEPQ